MISLRTDTKTLRIILALVCSFTTSMHAVAQGMAKAAPRAAGTVFRDCRACPEMVVLPAGSFTMGSPPSEQQWAATHGATLKSVADESPQHVVTLRSFGLSRYPVTRGEYARFVRETGHPVGDGCGLTTSKWNKEADLNWQHPGSNQGDRDPVVCVSWNDARAYIGWLNSKVPGRGSASGPYRLPSESEWEYAVRAGSTSYFWWGDDDSQAPTHAWFKDNAGGHTHPVGLKPANAFGLSDVVGNVWQWTEDCYAEDYAGTAADGRARITEKDCLRVDRGGSWQYPAWLLRSATRERNPADFRAVTMGFRVARTLTVAEVIREAHPARVQAPAPGAQFRDCSNGCPEMVMLPQGSFIMGAPPGEEERERVPAYFRGHSVPQHLVRIQYSLAIGKFDVTRDEYAQFVTETNRPDPDSCYTPDVATGKENDTRGATWHSPGFSQTGRDPVVCVSWDDAQAYVAWLSAKTGHVYRLPTEAEWEYAARAGTKTARYGSDKPAELCRYINHGDLNFSEQHPREPDANRECRDGYAFTSPVGSFPPNQFGLYDMLGNVWQWNEDCWNADYNGAPSDGSSWQRGDCGRRVVRGGAYSNISGLVLSAVRSRYKSPGRDHSGGFRVARTF